MRLFEQNEQAQSPQPQSLPTKKWYKRKGIIVAMLVVLVVLYLGHAIMYGWLNFHNCVYTEQILPIPQSVQGAIIKMEQDAYLIKGKSPDHCTSGFKNIDNEIVTDQNTPLYKSYYESEGLSFNTFPSGQTFTIKEIISETKHGITTIDSGPGPNNILILEDTQGNLYQMAAVYIGTTFDKDMPRFGYYKNGQRIGTLYATMFQSF